MQHPMLERNADNHKYQGELLKESDTNQPGIGGIGKKNCDHYYFFMHVNKVEISSYNMQNSIMKRPFPSERSSDVNESQRLLSEEKKKKEGKKCYKINFIAVI